MTKTSKENKSKLREEPKKPANKVIEVSKLLVKALRDLKQPNGCSISMIKKYIKEKYGPLPNYFTSNLTVALKRGICFGAINKTGGHYKLDSVMTVAARKPLRKKPKKGIKKSKKEAKVNDDA